MVDKKSLDFLPQTFRTATNRRFLNATMDQLIQEPNMSRIYGYIGRQDLSPSYVEGDAYVQELDSYSQYYQLEPGLVINKRIVGTDSFRKENAYNYVDLLNSISLAGGINTDHSRLFANEYYNYEGFVDLDKLINYGKYYWMPNGPRTIDVNSGGLATSKNFLISRPLGTDVISNAAINTNIGKVGYNVDAFPGKVNPTITLVRGGTYTFNVSQFGHPFWIQTEPGVDPGTTYQKNILRRDVFGVSGNGTEVGNITFSVPTKSAQYIFEQMPVFETVDLVTDLPFNLIQNAPYDEFVLKYSLDSLRSFESKKIIITNESDDFWYEPDNFGGKDSPNETNLVYDENSFPIDRPTESQYDRGIAVPVENRKGIWQLTVVNGKIKLIHIKNWPASTKIFVNEGRTYGHTYVFKDSQLKIYSVPNLTAPLDVLYYQDGVDPNVYGEIRIVDNPPMAVIDVNSIVGKPDYTSPNNVNFTNGLKIRFSGLIEPVEYTDKEYVVEGVGKSITLTAWEDLITPDPNNPNLGDGFGASGETYDELNYDFSLNAPLRKDYIVINRASVDGNGWSRTNRWFHEDVVKYSLTFNNPLASVVLDNNFRAIRPIIEFDSNLQLWNYGNKFVGPVTVIDAYITDVANQVEGRSPYVLVYPNKGKAITKRLFQNAKVNTKELKFDFVNDLSIDMRVIGANIQSNTVITEIDYNFKIVTLSKSIMNDLNANTDITFNGDYVSDSVPLEDGTKVIFVKEKYANVRNKIYSVKNIKPNSGVPQTKLVTAYAPRGSTRIKVLSTENLYVNMKVTGPTSVSEQGVTTYTVSNNTVIMTIDNDTDTITINNPLESDLGSGNSIILSNDSPQIHLTPIHDLSQGENVVAVSGITRQNAVYWWNNNTWQAAQHKFSLNQTPFFDVFNLDGISWGDKNYYASSTFTGSKLFGYKEGTGTRDYELGFALTYKSIGNIGDIVFENFYDTDTFNFNYNDKDKVVEISKGYVHEIDPTTLSYKLRNNWVAVQDLSKQFIEKKFVATENRLNNFFIDVAFKNSFNEKNFFVYVNGKELLRNVDFKFYTVSGELIFSNDLQVDDVLVIKIAGKPSGIKENYTLPSNLIDNSENNSFSTLTLGQIRNHLNEMTSNSLDYQILDTGNSNLRDINYKVIPGKILQHSAGVHIAQLMFNNETTNIVKAIDFNRRAYNRFKDRFFYLLSTMEFADTSDPRACLEDILEETTLYSSNDQSFYYTDMIPFGKNRYTLNEYPVYDTNYRKFNLIDSYDINEPGYQAVLVYQNNNQLRINKDYTVDGFVVQLTASLTLNIDDIISIYEYADTRGSMIPATPTKLGLYPKFTPELYLDDTYLGVLDQNNINYVKYPRPMIQGHDGSKIFAFEDYRDNIILEFENRIYNNINVTYVNDTRTSFTGIEPGAFRDTDYNLDEWTQLLSGTFLSWAGTNNINVFVNDTVKQNAPFTFNYGQGVDKINGEGLPGYWRAIYKYFYDTDRPHTHPWEMLGFTEQPDWWEVRYGPAPYTAGNEVLWEDMELGIVYQRGTDSYVDPRYARPGLLHGIKDKDGKLISPPFIPVTVHGELLSPLSVLVTNWNQQTAGATWRFGDQSPQETAWRRSSDYPFAIQIAWALARPAQYCSLSLNRRDLIRIDSLNQIINKTTSNRKLVLSVTDDTQYVPGSNIWIRDRLVDLNLDIDDNFINIFNYYTLNLIYKSSGFTDKSYFQIIADQSSPNSTNTGIVIPQENYNLVVTKSAPVGIATYSAVIVEKSATGFTVRGFDNNKPYFTIIPRVYNNNNYTVKVSNSAALVYEDDADVINVIPYGTQLSTRQQVVDFLISYGRYLTSLGFQFIDTTSDDTIPTVANWNLAVKEFLFWIEQGWDINTVISLTPAGTKINFDSDFGIVDEITNSFNGNRILDNNGKTLQNKDYTTYRSDTAFELILKDTTKGIHLVDLVVVQYEHTIVFDNITVFNDVIYEPSLGNRQYRMKISGFKTRDWNGSLYAPGFMINHVPVEEWQSIHDYYKGDIVKHKNLFYTARNFIPGSTKFNTSSWYEISGTMLDKQLIPNLAFNAQQFEHFYDVNEFDINRYADSMARNSTGFVPRNYMSSMGLDNISQHKFYLGMIKEKGTQAAINAFLRAKMPYVDNEIQIDEQWAIRLGTYGGISQKDDIEVSLANAKSLNGSYLIEFLDSADSRNSNWNTFKPMDLLIKPAVFNKSLFAQNEKHPKIVPTSGYVLPSEVNVSVFDMKKIYNINSLARSMGEGSRIWVASDKLNDWNVYRITADINLVVTDSTIINDQVEFKTQVPHGLRINDFVMLRNATLKSQGKDISGFYQVLSVSNNTFRVPAYPNVTTATGQLNGELYKLKSVRFNSRAEFAVSAPGKGWKLYDQAWIDGINDEWQVMVNKPIYSAKQSLTPVFAVQADNFGSAIDVKPTQDIMVVGAENKTSAGSVYVYRYGGDGTWGIIDSVSPKDSYAEKFGHCLQYNDLDCAVVGAPESNSSTGLAYIMKTTSSQVAISQALYFNNLNAGDEFGRSVTTSQNGIWVAVGSPGANTVHVWKYVEVDSSVRTVALEGSITHEMSAGAIDVDATASDVQVKLNGNLLIPYLDYTTDGRDLTLTSLPVWTAYTDYVNGSLVTNTVSNVTTVYTVTKSFTSGATFQTNIGTTHTGTVISNNGFSIEATITTDTQPEVGGKFTSSGGTIKTITQVTNNITSYTLRFNSAINLAESSSITFKDRDALVISQDILTMAYESYYKYITGFTNGEVDGRFGESVNFNGDGSQLAVGAPELDITLNNITYPKMGSAYIFERTIETFVADGTSSSFDLEFKDSTTFDLYNDTYADSSARYGTIHVNDPLSGLSGAPTTFDTYTVILSGYVLDPLSPLSDSPTLFPDFSAILPVVTVNGVETTDYSISPAVSVRTLTLDSIPSKDSLVTIETNNFQLLTKVKSPRSQNYLQFGKKVVLCPTTCSLYVGATGYNNTSRNNGAVFRFINLARLYGGIVAQRPNPTFVVGSGIRLNGVKVTFTGTTLNAAVADINNANIPGVSATVLNNQYLRITSDSKIAYNKLVLNTLALATPYDTTVYEDILLSVFAYGQLILNPADSDSAAFGKQISLDRTATKLLVSSDTASNKIPMTFDVGRTSFDRNTTLIQSVYYRSGAAYLFEYQGDVGEDANTHGNFTLAQKFAEPNMATNDKYGTAIAITSNWVMITANSTRKETGTVYTYSNATGQKNWQVLREKTISVDSRKIDKIFLYNDYTKTLIATLPVLDPEHGIPVPSAAEQIRYIVNYDPAVYSNVPNTFTFSKDTKNAWAGEHVGQLWWDTNNIKYADWNQGTLLDKFSNWGLSFPNSYVNVYEWIESDMSPSQYGKTYPMAGPLYTASDVYTTKSVIDPHSLQPNTKYYFWVKNSNLNSNLIRRDSALALQNLISNPRNINIPFAAVVSDNAIALFNCQDIVNNDTRLHITVKKVLDNNDIHQEWSMFDDGTDLGIAQEFFDRLNDSLAGEDAQGKMVPDQNLTEKQKYGLGIRPRQTTFADKFSARKIWIDNVNSVLIQHPIALLRDLSSLYEYDAEPVVDNTTIKFAVDFDSEIEYINKAFYNIGDKALIRRDSITGGWTIRQLSVDPANTDELIWSILQVQKYDIRNYWVYTDWYAKQFSTDTPIRKILDFDYQISSTDIEVGDVIKINNGGDGNWKLILVNSDGLELVGQQNATIQLSSNLYDNTGAGFGIDNTSFEITPFAKDCSIEFRKIFNIVNNSLLNEQLRSDFKKVVKVMIDTIATQFEQSDWLFKTSLINIKNRVRGLDQIPVYVKETDNIVTDFINEIKPYHTKIKGYTSSYDKIDLSGLDVVDFDLPPYYNAVVAKYREPQLGNLIDTIGEEVIDNKVNYISILTTPVYKSWLENHTYGINLIDIENSGTGYTSDVVVTIIGDGTGATADAYVRNGSIYDVVVTNPGKGYTYAIITLNGLGSGAKLYAKLGNATARTIHTTMDFSRFTYDTQTRDWKAKTYYSLTDVILYNNIVYRLAIANLLDTESESTVLKVNNFSIVNNGSDYRTGDILTVNGGSTQYVTELINGLPTVRYPAPFESASFKVVNIKVGSVTVDPANAGTGYTVGNRLKFTSKMSTPIILNVTSVGSPAGNITGVEIISAGVRTLFPDIPSIKADIFEQSTGSSNLGKDAKFLFTWSINSLELVNAGTYTVLPSNPVTTTSSVGTGATLTLDYEIKGIITDSPIITDEGIIINDGFSDEYLVEYQVRKWYPYNSYNKDTIVVYNNVPYVALTNFVSDRYFEFNSNITNTNSDDWQPNSNYKINTLLNYGGTAYKVVDDYFDISQPNPDPVTGDNHKTPIVFNENHLSTIFPLAIYNGGYFDDAASKVWSYYRPTAGMAGRDLEQVMTGISYPGVNVIGPNFDQAPGFDFGIYEQITYDTRTYDENGLVDIYGDQTLDSNYFSLYKDTQLGLRPEDILTDGAAYIDENSSHAPEELVPGHIFDTLDIRVKTLADITVSGSPELVVIGVYADDVLTRYSFNPAITNTPLPIAGIERIFVLNDIVGLQVENVDYIVNYEKMYVQFFKAPQIPSTILITIVGNSGENVVSDSEFIGDGLKTEFVIEDFTLSTVKQAYVKVNNQIVTAWSLLRATIDQSAWIPNQQYSKDDYITYNYFTYRVLEDFVATETFDFSKVQSANSIVIRFDNAPANGAVIQIHLFNIPDTLPNKDTFKSYSQINLQKHVVPNSFVSGGTLDYEIPLDQTIEYVQPFEAMMYVRINGSIIEPSSQAYYVANGVIDNYSLPTKRTVDDVTKISDSDIVVVVDKVTKVNNFDYTINRNGVDLPTITFSSTPAAGSKITISNRRMSQYAIYNENILNIKSNAGLTAGDIIEIISYSNHDTYDIFVEVFDGTKTLLTSTVLGFEDNGFDLSSFENEQSNVVLAPFYELSRPVHNINNFKMSLNGAELIPFYDYSFNSPTSVRIDPAYGVVTDDIIVIQHISEKTRQENVEYRIFKGITETYEYLGISSGTTTKLKQDLLVDDTWIYVENINVLSQPDPNSASPGVVFINGERITFYVIDFINSRLGQLRRATNGTGAADIHLAGTRVDDGGIKVEIPNSRDSYVIADTDKIIVGKTGGQQIITAGSLIRQGQTWLNPGLGSAADGLGILAADTIQVNFLRSL